MPTSGRQTSSRIEPEARVVDSLADGVRAAVGELTGVLQGTVGIVAPVARLDEVQCWLDSWEEHAADAAGGSDARLVVLGGLDTKGLEFDGIVVVQPQEIEDEATTGRATLYVVYTRATQRMTTLTLR